MAKKLGHKRESPPLSPNNSSRFTLPQITPTNHSKLNTTMRTKRQAVSLATNKVIFEYQEQHPAAIHKQLQGRFGLYSKKTFTGILIQKDKYIEAAKQLESSEAGVRKWLRECEYSEVLYMSTSAFAIFFKHNVNML